MTRLAILADIHSNLPALEAVLEDLAQFTVDQIIVAGDLVNWGPFSAQVVDRLADERCAIIRGNNELYITDWNTARAPQHWARFTLPPYTIAQLGEKRLNAICAWPDSLSLRFRDAPAIRVAHGTPRSAFEPIFAITTDEDVREKLAGVTESTVILAHTHLALDRTVDNWHMLNPGSVGNPLDGELTASYLLLEGDQTGWRGTFRRVAFDVKRVLDEFERTRFVERCGVVGHLVVQEYHSARMEVMPFIEWWSQTCPNEAHTYELLNRFSRVNKRDYMPLPYKIGMS